MMQGDSNQLPPALPRDPNIGLAIASLICGVLALALSFLLLGILLAIVGVVLGIVHLRGAQSARAMAGWGIGLSVVGFFAGAAFLGLYTWFYVYQIMPMMAEFEDEPALDIWEGVRSPDLTLTTLDGQTLTLSELKGKRVVLAMWATWCPPCAKEVPHFIKLTEEVPPEDLIIIGVSDEPEEDIRKFAEEKGINYALVSTSDLPAPYSDVMSIPATFMIDRNGVIQRVLEGYHDYEDLHAAATAPDFEGTPLDSPPEPVNELAEPAQAYEMSEAWSVNVDDASGLCAADWNGDGAVEILVCTHGSSLTVLSANGETLQTLSLPDAYQMIEAGRFQGENRLLGYVGWGDRIDVINPAGVKQWSYEDDMGVNGAHWIDIDGDGTDEMLAGFNGGGGLHLISAEGTQIWRRELGNVWNQATVRTPDGKVRLLATEAGGVVHIYDGEGNLLEHANPRGDYYTEVAAAVVDGAETLQLMAGGNERVVAMDESGKEIWSTPADDTHSAGRNTAFASGDFNQDGTLEWAFIGLDGALLVASPAGELLAQRLHQNGTTSFAFADQHLVTLRKETITGYTFQPLPPAPAESAIEADSGTEAATTETESTQEPLSETAPASEEAPTVPAS